MKIRSFSVFACYQLSAWKHVSATLVQHVVLNATLRIIKLLDERHNTIIIASSTDVTRTTTTHQLFITRSDKVMTADVCRVVWFQSMTWNFQSTVTVTTQLFRPTTWLTRATYKPGTFTQRWITCCWCATCHVHSRHSWWPRFARRWYVSDSNFCTSFLEKNELSDSHNHYRLGRSTKIFDSHKYDHSSNVDGSSKFAAHP